MLKKIMTSFLLAAVSFTTIAQARTFDSAFLDSVQNQNVNYVHDTHSSDTLESAILLELSSESPQAWSNNTIALETTKTPSNQIKQSLKRHESNIKENTLVYFSSENPEYSARPAFLSDTILRKSYERKNFVPKTFRAVPYFDKVTRNNFGDFERLKEKDKRAMIKALRYKAVFKNHKRR